MAKDLGFFSLVWAILTLAFGAAMHGALHGEDNGGDSSPTGGGGMSAESGKNRQPMQQWWSWWLIRTYLQSLGEVGLQYISLHYTLPGAGASVGIEPDIFSEHD